MADPQLEGSSPMALRPRVPWLTGALVLVNLVVFLTTTQGGRLELDDLVRSGGKVGPLVMDLAETWRLLTASFLHADWLHLGLNLAVLFYVGGLLEGLAPRWDVLRVVVWSSVATMGLSLLLNDAPSVGASGVVFGSLGAVVAMGWRHRQRLSPRLRRTLLDGVLPGLVGLVAISLTVDGVDHWAHVGGLAAGLAVGSFVQPRPGGGALGGSSRGAPVLASDGPPSRPLIRARLRSALDPVALIFLVLLGQPLLGGWLPVTRSVRDEDFGLVMPIPRGWKQGANPLGSLAWYNGLPHAGRASIAVEAVAADEGGDASLEARRLAIERIERALGAGVTVGSPQVVRVGGVEAQRLTGASPGPGGGGRLKAWFIPRGRLVFQVVFLWPAAFDAYEAVGEAIVSGLRFEEPRALRVARGEVLLVPSAGAMGRLGLALWEQGEVGPAVEALRAAVRAAPQVVAYRVGLSRALLEQGEVEAACQASHDALVYEGSNPAALEADARCELSRGNARRALERLEEALAAQPGDERLESAASKLRASVSDFK